MIGATAVYLCLLGLFLYTIAPTYLVDLASAASVPETPKQQSIAGIKPEDRGEIASRSSEIAQLPPDNPIGLTEQTDLVIPQGGQSTSNFDGAEAVLANESALTVETAVWPTVDSNLETAVTSVASETASQRPIAGQSPNIFTAFHQEENLPQHGQLIIPSIGVNHIITNVPVVNGNWDISQLETQVGHLQTTGEHPGDNVAMTFIGHVTVPWPGTGPFADLILLEHGEEIIYRWNGFDYVYEVSRILRVRPEDVHVLYHDDPNSIQLATCSGWNLLNREYGERLVTRATLVRVEPITHQ